MSTVGPPDVIDTEAGDRPTPPSRPTLRDRAIALVEAKWFQTFIIVAILFNAVILGIETIQDLDHGVWEALHLINGVLVGIFVVEIVLRIYAHRLAFFKDGWGWFDLIIVIIALIPASAGGQVFRVLRALRVLRLLSTVRSMRLVVGALGAAMTGIVSIGALLAMVIYIFAVVTTTLFHTTPGFADLGQSVVSLFRLMMGDGWTENVVPIADSPGVWVLFIGFAVISGIIVLNLFIAVIVEAMDRVKEADQKTAVADVPAEAETPEATDPTADLVTEIRELRHEVARLSARLDDGSPRS